MIAQARPAAPRPPGASAPPAQGVAALSAQSGSTPPIQGASAPHARGGPSLNAPAALVRPAPGAGGRAHPPAGAAEDFAWRYKSPREDLCRRRLAWASGVACVAFLAFAAWGVATRTAFAPVPFGSTLWIELGMELLPGLWILGPVHNLMLALAAGTLLAGATTAHAEVPGHPKAQSTQVWRRQSRFVFPQALLATLLFGASLALHMLEYPLLATLFQGPGWLATLAVVARLWLPISRRWLLVEYFAGFRDGMANRIVTGGLVGFNQATTTIFQDDFISAQRVMTPFEFVAGQAGVLLRHHDRHEVERTLRIDALGPIKDVDALVNFLNGRFTVAHSLKAAKKSPYLQNNAAPGTPPAAASRP